MKIPNFIDVPFVEKDTGRLTPVWKFLLEQLFLQLQKNVSDEGFVIPSLSETDIGGLVQAVDGTIVYNKTTNTLQVRQSGIFRTITTI